MTARVSVVTPNPAVDVTYEVGEQRLGETVRVRSVLRRPGGKGLNVARVLATLGVDVVTLQPLGGSAGRWIAEQLAVEGLPAEVVEIAGETRSTVTVTDGLGHPTVLAEPGPSVPDGAWRQLVQRTRASCVSGGVLVVAGSLPTGTALGWVGELVTAGRAAGARVVVDVSGPVLLAAAQAGADLLTPNAEEAMAATGAPDLETALVRLREAGARGLVVSRGAEGLLTVDTAGRRHEQPGVPGVRGNPTGAGDAATAGIALAQLRDAPPEVALRWAALLGAAAVLRPAAGEVDPADVADLATRIPPLPASLEHLDLPTPR